MNQIRPITTNELYLVKQILDNLYETKQKNKFCYSNSVATLNDGGMGSFCFYYNNSTFIGILEGKTYATGEIEFYDEGGIGCLATLYTYDDNRLAELDIWKYDFPPLKQIPKEF